ncbi:hypothetical protein pb186bvf_007412 [Paramecium bursaria]
MAFLLYGLCCFFSAYCQLTLYPTQEEQFIFPINKLGIPTSSNYSINKGWKVIQPYVQDIIKINQNITAMAIGNINGDSNSITNIFGVLANKTLYLYEIDKISLKQEITYNSSLQCLDLDITGTSNLIILNCLNNTEITLLQVSNNQLTQIPLDKQLSIENSTLKDASITYTETGYLLLYIFNNFYQQYQFIYGSNIIEYKGLFYSQSITTYVSYFGSTFILSPQNLSVNGKAAVQTLSNSFTNMALLTVNYYLQEYIIILLTGAQLDIYISNSDSQLFYVRTITLQKVYQNIQVTQNYIYLFINQSIDTFTFQNYQIKFYTNLPIKYNQLYTIQPQNILFVPYNNQLSIIKHQDSFITTQGVNITQVLQISGYDNYQVPFQCQLTSIPISYSDTNIYLIEANIIVQAQHSQQFVNVQNLSVGTNQTFTLQNQTNGTQFFNKIQQNVSVISLKNTLIDLYYSDIQEMWIQVQYNNDNYQFTVSQLEYDFNTQKLEPIQENTYVNNFSNTAIDLQIITIQDKYFIIFYGVNYTQIFQFTLISIQFTQTITMRQNQQIGTIGQIQSVQDKLYIYYSNFQQIYQYQYYEYNLTGPILINITCSQPSIESNQLSYPQQLFIGCQGNIYIIQQTYGILGYYVIKNISINYNAIIAPIQGGLYVYEYNQTYSQLFFIHLLDDIVITRVNTYELSLDYNITYSYSNKFFYIQQISISGQIYQSIYYGEYMQQSSQYFSYQGQSIKCGVYQAQEYDLVYRYGEQIYIDYVPHFTMLQIFPQFNYQLQINISSSYLISNQYAISNNIINTVFTFEELYIRNNQPSIFAIMQNLTYSNYSLEGYIYKIPEHLTGSIQNYEMTCVNCTNLTYVQPLQYQYSTLQQSQQLLNYKDVIYVLIDYNEILLFNQQSNQTIFLDPNLGCYNLFIEQFSQNLCWVCQNLLNKIIYLYSYDQLTTQTTFTILGVVENAYLLQSNYQAPMVQLIFAPNIYFLYYFTIINVQLTLQQLISSQIISIKQNSYSLSITYQSSIDTYCYGLLTYQSSNRLYFFISKVYLNGDNAVLIQNNEFTISDPLFDFQSPISQFCGDIIYQQSLNLTIMEFILCNNNPFVLQITMNQLQIQNYQILCSINQLNYTNSKYQDNQVQYYNNMITTIVFNAQNQDLILYLYYINQSICQDRAVLQPIQYLMIQNQTSKFTTIQIINNNTIALLLNDYIQFYSIWYGVLTLYKPNTNNVMLVMKAINPASQSTIYIQLVQSVELGRSWLFWLVIGLVAFFVIGITILIICIVRYKEQKRYEQELYKLQNEPQLEINQG